MAGSSGRSRDTARIHITESGATNGTRRRYQHRPLLSQVKTPTLVIHCDRDQQIVPERGHELAAAIAGVGIVSLPSANHLMLEDEPAWALFLEELGLFLDW